MRSYTLAEIDEMRSLVSERMRPSGSYYEKEQIVRVEEALRTLMTNGTALEELREEKRRRDEESKPALREDVARCPRRHRQY